MAYIFIIGSGEQITAAAARGYGVKPDRRIFVSVPNGFMNHDLQIKLTGAGDRAAAVWNAQVDIWYSEEHYNNGRYSEVNRQVLQWTITRSKSFEMKRKFTPRSTQLYEITAPFADGVYYELTLFKDAVRLSWDPATGVNNNNTVDEEYIIKKRKAGPPTIEQLLEVSDTK